MAATIKEKQAGNIDGYIAGFPEQIRKKLEEMRMIVKKAAPGAEETINYGVPTLILSGNLIHFGGFKNHIGFYPAPSGIEAFKKELSVYEGAKGSVKFPVNKPLPAALIAKIVKFRAQENMENPVRKAKH